MSPPRVANNLAEQQRYFKQLKKRRVRSSLGIFFLNKTLFPSFREKFGLLISKMFLGPDFQSKFLSNLIFVENYNRGAGLLFDFFIFS